MADSTDKFNKEETEFFKDKSNFVEALYLYIRKGIDANQKRQSEIERLKSDILKLEGQTRRLETSLVDAKASLKGHGIEWDTISTLFKL